MKKFICESLEELKEFYYNEPEGEERVPAETRDAMYQVGKENFEKVTDPQDQIEEELFEYFLELISDTANYTDLDRASIERVFQKALDTHYNQEG